MTPQNQTASTTLSPSQQAKALKNTTVQSNAQLLARIAELEAKEAAAKAAAEAKQHFTLKVSLKGAVSAYGLGRFPVTLYGGQWERLIANAAKVTEFMAAHKAELATKGE